MNEDKLTLDLSKESKKAKKYLVIVCVMTILFAFFQPTLSGTLAVYRLEILEINRHQEYLPIAMMILIFWLFWMFIYSLARENNHRPLYKYKVDSIINKRNIFTKQKIQEFNKSFELRYGNDIENNSKEELFEEQKNDLFKYLEIDKVYEETDRKIKSLEEEFCKIERLNTRNFLVVEIVIPFILTFGAILVLVIFNENFTPKSEQVSKVEIESKNIKLESPDISTYVVQALDSPAK